MMIWYGIGSRVTLQILIAWALGPLRALCITKTECRHRGFDVLLLDEIAKYVSLRYLYRYDIGIFVIRVLDNKVKNIHTW